MAKCIESTKCIKFEVTKTGSYSKTLKINAIIDWNGKTATIPIMTYYHGNNLICDSDYWDKYLSDYLHNKVKKTKFSCDIPFKYGGRHFSFHTCIMHKRYNETSYTIDVDKCDRGILVEQLQKLKLHQSNRLKT